MPRLYRIHEFAELAGVTVKALHHYDRLGLLIPARTESGYRMYAERDLERLEQIVALKFLGLPLKRICSILDGPPLELADALRLQRLSIEEKQTHLARGLRAIRAAEGSIEPGKPPDPAILKRLIEVIAVQNEIEAMKKYYTTEEAWQKRKRYYEEGPSPEWQELYNDIRRALDEDPARPHAQGLADRWLQLAVRAQTGDPAVQTDSMRAWQDRQNWPPIMKRRLAEFQMEEVNRFVQRVSMAARKKYYSEEAWEKRLEMLKQAGWQAAAGWQERVDLFAEIERALASDPADKTGQALAARWMAHLDTISGGDAGIRAAMTKLFEDWRHWPATLRWTEEGICRLTGDRFDRAMDFLDRAVASMGAYPG
jgi:DNA-binding transcriptional MerR regulator